MEESRREWNWRERMRADEDGKIRGKWNRMEARGRKWNRVEESGGEWKKMEKRGK